jgi:hypothetical protein
MNNLSMFENKQKYIINNITELEKELIRQKLRIRKLRKNNRKELNKK